jgi:hypothetical protein
MSDFPMKKEDVLATIVAHDILTNRAWSISEILKDVYKFSSKTSYQDYSIDQQEQVISFEFEDYAYGDSSTFYIEMPLEILWSENSLEVATNERQRVIDKEVREREERATEERKKFDEALADPVQREKIRKFGLSKLSKAEKIVLGLN